ncbi:RelA/SpoT family protein [Streptomyces alkaliterrae]|uniref:Bifunctional (P)ppGpp synthetase/guanosine-3',5'-bis(Diphosphate) 3'-pyrophosphohydrolase n=1 Tax=Streptomyces alkaliterrae TaxID=2213162 RepID=A0A5P0YU58_9ACTN|nr:HD domain-containing protein [Streptomyces alkaliterrae]MBB1253019.1 bifunctional (p)ppGpp synthetase/guanosine-3',5'-bis(diphosphate) 3'-pyrophosphohydrolase [Streptomyces alkaliterrae]MBB1260284.1 bifunctional (p)ppGpp synthetase/guanosine-3',5'-bis(diphosphate) 3'-pyrophosphohydrolase [Streptomyces alkaliterrae]MQS02009.1 HD domain-containing protein [Streptomyces alkaliterrae]
MSAVRSLRKLGRAALLGTTPRGGLPNALEHVAQAHRRHHPGADLDALSRAYVLAESSHRGQMRKSGEPYITHPLAVTLILAELGAEATTLTASLLHDTVEDTELTLDQVRSEFGDEVAYLVDGVTKLEKVDYGAAAEPETFRKMLLATGSDVRVMSIKLADRLHNMRTLGVMRPEKQARIAKVTRDVLIPLAERLGVQALKTELEDLVFEILHPEEHRRTDALIRAHREEPDPLEELAEVVRGVLREARVGAEVLIRPRHHLSVHRYRLKRGRLGPCDFGRLLILVGEEADCYAVLGELHTCFTPLISEFKDFIAVPKFNLYQSLHTAFADSSGRVAEVLVRTHRMHRVAEAGVIALGDPHRTDGAEDAEADRDTDGERADPTRPGWLSRLLEWQSHAPDPDTFWAELRDDLAQDREITVFVAELGSTADSVTLHLPAGATCVDAAYARHGGNGHRCVGARVDGRLTTLGTVLRDGDAVQLLMAAEGGASGPSPDWLEHARTPAARLAIRRWLEAHPEEPGPGPKAPEPTTSDATATEATSGEPPAPEVTADPAAADPAGAPAVAEPTAAETPRGDRRTARTESAAVAEGLPDRPVRLARCCTPVPPDPVTGFAVRGGAVTVHREGCASVARMAGTGRAPVPVRWRPSADASCRVTLRAEAFGRPHLLADLTETIAVQGAAVLFAAVEPPRQQRVRHTYTLRLEDAAELPALMRAMREVPGVYDVFRAAQPAL